MVDSSNVLDVIRTPLGPVLTRNGRPVFDLPYADRVLLMLEFAADMFREELGITDPEAEALAAVTVLGHSGEA